MRRIVLLSAALCMILTSCGGARNARIDELQELYGALAAYTAETELEIVRGEENLNYTVRYEKDGETLRATALAPETVSGITAAIRDDDLTLEYDGMILDAGTANEKLSALTCVPLLLRSLPESYISSWSETTLEEKNALRLTYETGWGGETLSCTIYIGDDNRPIYAEISESGEIIVFAGFTDFTFDDMISSDE